VQADDAGLALKLPGSADGRDEEDVVRGSGDAEMERVVALVELRVVLVDVPVTEARTALSISRSWDGLARLAASLLACISCMRRNSKSICPATTS
jgi:hypothetical protein